MTINPKEAPKGYRAAQSGGNGYCAMCAYRGKADCYRTDCAPAYRRDGCNVHFVKLPKKQKPAKPRRKPHVAWVVTADANHNGVDWQYCVAYRSRSLARGHIAHMRKLGWDGVRGPVKVVLP